MFSFRMLPSQYNFLTAYTYTYQYPYTKNGNMGEGCSKKAVKSDVNCG